MKYSNLHTHTSFSDGAHTVEENIKSAIALGMSSLGFSDHCYTYFDTSYCIKKDDVAKYIAEVRKQAAAYAHCLPVYLGIELDGFAFLDNPSDYDYIIGDCHYVNTPDGYRAVDLARQDFIDSINNYFDGDGVKLAVSYYESYAKCIKEMKPHVLGHIDLVTKYSLVDTADSRYRDAANDALEASLKITPVIELNTGAISRGYRKEPYPESFLIKRIGELGGKILLSADSHDASALTCFFDESVEILRAHGISSVVEFNGKGFNEVGI